MAADDSPDAVDDVIPSPIIEPYSEFVIQMKHYTSFVEDWHNLSRIGIQLKLQRITFIINTIN